MIARTESFDLQVLRDILSKNLIVNFPLMRGRIFLVSLKQVPPLISLYRIKRTLSRTERVVLDALKEIGPLSTSQLASRLMLPLGRIHETVSTLQSDLWIFRLRRAKRAFVFPWLWEVVDRLPIDSSTFGLSPDRKEALESFLTIAVRSLVTVSRPELTRWFGFSWQRLREPMKDLIDDNIVSLADSSGREYQMSGEPKRPLMPSANQRQEYVRIIPAQDPIARVLSKSKLSQLRRQLRCNLRDLIIYNGWLVGSIDYALRKGDTLYVRSVSVIDSAFQSDNRAFQEELKKLAAVHDYSSITIANFLRVRSRQS